MAKIKKGFKLKTNDDSFSFGGKQVEQKEEQNSVKAARSLSKST